MPSRAWRVFASGHLGMQPCKSWCGGLSDGFRSVATPPAGCRFLARLRAVRLEHERLYVEAVGGGGLGPDGAVDLGVAGCVV